MNIRTIWTVLLSRDKNIYHNLCFLSSDKEIDVFEYVFIQTISDACLKTDV